MVERPILFSGPMVRAILDGRKTQTRRIVKQCAQFRRWDSEPRHAYRAVVADDGSAATFLVAGDQGYTDSVPCPYGKTGDRLWVRETWNYWESNECVHDEDDPCAPHCRQVYVAYASTPRVGYRPVPDRSRITYLDETTPLDRNRRLLGPWRPPIRMPRWASRLTLEVTGVRVRRLQDISDDDADAEGVEAFDGWIDEAAIARKASEMRWSLEDSRAWFAVLWDEINGDRAPWASNPWVWVIEFKVVEPKEIAR